MKFLGDQLGVLFFGDFYHFYSPGGFYFDYGVCSPPRVFISLGGFGFLRMAVFPWGGFFIGFFYFRELCCFKSFVFLGFSFSYGFYFFMGLFFDGFFPLRVGFPRGFYFNTNVIFLRPLFFFYDSHFLTVFFPYELYSSKAFISLRMSFSYGLYSFMTTISSRFFFFTMTK